MTILSTAFRFSALTTGLLLGGTLLASTTWAGPVPRAGTDFEVLAAQGPLERPGMIEVREFFWYGCGHCYTLEPYIAQWERTKPADVNFVRTPAALNTLWEQAARGFYSVQMMGKLPQTHAALFDAIHNKGQRVLTQPALASFYSRYGVNPNQFNALFNSFAVTGKVNQSKQLALRYRLTGVPAVVVNGKYVVKGEGPRTIEVVNYLINQERARMPKATAARKAA